MTDKREEALRLQYEWLAPKLSTIERKALDRIMELTSAQPQQEPVEGSWIASDDVDRLARELDMAMNGEKGAANHPALIDVVAQAKKIFGNIRGPIVKVDTEDGTFEWLLPDGAVLPVGTLLYASPPAQAMPEGWSLEYVCVAKERIVITVDGLREWDWGPGKYQLLAAAPKPGGK